MAAQCLLAALGREDADTADEMARAYVGALVLLEKLDTIIKLLTAEEK